MTPIDFCYWLQGWVEMEGGKKPNLQQWKMITEHLGLVFQKVTPALGEDSGLTFEDDLPKRLCEKAEKEDDSDLVDYESMEEVLRRALDLVNEEPPQVMFTPPTCSARPPTLSNEKICSPNPIQEAIHFCAVADRLPRKLHEGE